MGWLSASVPFIGDAAPIKSLLGTRMPPSEEDKTIPDNPTASDYVDDGLLAMWDGIENDGIGIHNPTLSGWKDISGNSFNLAKVNSNYTLSWGDECLMLDGTATGNGVLAVASTNFQNLVRTQEIVCTVAPTGATQSIYSFGNGKGQHSGVAITSTGYICCCAMTSESLKTETNSVICATWTLKDVPGQGNAENVFKNGRQVESGTNTGASIGAYSYSNRMLVGMAYGSRYKYIGNIFAIRLYDRALTADEIAYNYKLDKARFNLP